MGGTKEILSVGIDIGTSTTQLVFSRLSVENTAGYFTVPRVSIVDKRVVYQSAIHSTPLKTQSLLDGDGVREIVDAEFKQAGFTPDDTDTGAVIITGESARKENSAMVLDKLSGFAGEFVVSTAGPDLEAIIAGKGSGAQQYSEDYCCTAVNLDIGGGTTNLVLFDCGRVVAKGCLDVGGRLVRVTPDLVVDYISPATALVARHSGIDLQTGVKTSVEALRGLCRGMAQLLEQALGLAPPSTLLSKLKTGGSSSFCIPKPIHSIFFSGGVADAVYQSSADHNPFIYSDIGLLLGEAIREGQLCSAFRLVRSRETIRATVVGAGSYTTSISGSTITYTDHLFPLKNLPVIKLEPDEQEAAFCGDPAPAVAHIRWFLEQSDSNQPVIAMVGEPNPSYERIKTLARSLVVAAEQTLTPKAPLLLVVECDMAKALGQTVQALAGGRAVIALDSIAVEQNDYIDMGRPLMDGLVIPVVVKTLVFG